MRTAPYTSVTPTAFRAITAPFEMPITRIWSSSSAQEVVMPQVITILILQILLRLGRGF